MTITEGRVDRSRQKKERRWTRFSRTYKVIITLSLFAGILFIASIINLYEGTKQWSSSRAHIEMANIDPEYVSDYPSVDADAFVKMSDSVNGVLKSIEDNQKAPDNFGEVLKSSRDFLSQYNITTGHLYQSVARLELYAKYYDLLKIAYTAPNSSQLKDVYVGLSNEVLAHGRESDKGMVSNLNEIINRYDQFNQFITEVLPKYGTINGDTYEIDPSIEDLSHLLDAASQLTEFPSVREFIEVISKHRDDVTKNNKAYNEKVSYENFKELSTKLSGIYVQASSVKTVEDVIKNGWVVNGRHKNTDKVVEIRYNGNRINGQDWIRIDLKPDVILEEPKIEVPRVETTQPTRTTTTQQTTTGPSTTTPNTSSDEYRP